MVIDIGLVAIQPRAAQGRSCKLAVLPRFRLGLGDDRTGMEKKRKNFLVLAVKQFTDSVLVW